MLTLVQTWAGNNGVTMDAIFKQTLLNDVTDTEAQTVCKPANSANSVTATLA